MNATNRRRRRCLPHLATLRHPARPGPGDARTPRAATPAVPLLCLLLAGCASSLDPAEDIAASASLVEARAGLGTGWTAPWYERAVAWDGRADLTPEAAVRTALQNNRDIRGRVESIAAARADLVQAQVLPNPIVNLEYGEPTDGLGGDPLAVGIIQQLAWLWSRPIAIDAAEADLRARILSVSDAALRLVADVRRTHAEIYFAQVALEKHEENVALLQASRDLFRELYDAGEASRLDLNRVALDLDQAQVRLTDRRARLERSKRSMLALLGRAEDRADWRAVATDQARTAAPTPDELEVAALASSHRLDVVAAEAAREARAARLRLAERGRLPDVTASVHFRQNFSGRPAVLGGAAITPKIFDDNSARIELARSELRQAEIEADRVRQEAVAEARRAWIDLTAQQRIASDYDQRLVGLAESNLELARNAFDAGEADLTVLLDAQRRVNDARIELADRRLAAAAQRVELERAVGGTLRWQPPLVDILARDDAGRGGAP